MTKSIVREIDGINRSLLIRWSTDEDVHQIRRWLEEEDRLGIDGNFLCNWNLTVESHQEGKLLVLVDETDGTTLAYQWGQLLQSGILQVRDRFRSKGLGMLVVEHCVELALQQDEMVLQVECKPSSSIPFWKKMGFTIFGGEYGRNAKGYRILSKSMRLPLDGSPKDVSINIYPEERCWREDVAPILSASPDAVLGDDGKLYLAERVSCSDMFEGRRYDPVVEILMDGELICRDKVRYKGALNHGVRQCRNGFYVDTVTI